MEGRLDVETSNRPCGRISRSLAFAAMRKGEARMRRSKGPKPLRRTPLSDSPARRETPTMLKSIEPPYTDPYVRWCGRGGVARLPPIPILGTFETSRMRRAMSEFEGKAEKTYARTEFFSV